ncbi:MAG: NADH-quinone oxidoreductase subunit J [Steroidobacteraceae bacterium]|nr:NADH-quinone oxidoreductase subunit J [Steroidobacteraceae bacterium]MDW8258867.1 NADH-quinone oxidoreductase subunit J [Gammaproteobacteria bacterium]
MLVSILFWLFSVVLIAAALGVIVARNPVHSALALVLAFVTSAALWLLIEAEFLAIILVLVYVGAVMVLFLFVVMMLDINFEELRRGFTRYAWLGWIVAGIVIVELVGVVAARQFGLDVRAGMAPVPPDYSNTRDLGTALYTDYLYPLQLAGILLLLAIVAAIALTMRRRAGLKVQDVSEQVRVDPRTRIRIVKVAAQRGADRSTQQPGGESRS